MQKSRHNLRPPNKANLLRPATSARESDLAGWMLLALTLASAILLPHAPVHPHAHAPAGLALRGSVRCCNDADADPSRVVFLALMEKGGMAVQEGELGRALSCFRKALELQPEAKQTKAMVERLEALGIVAVDEDGTSTIDVSAESAE